MAVMAWEEVLATVWAAVPEGMTIPEQAAIRPERLSSKNHPKPSSNRHKERVMRQLRNTPNQFLLLWVLVMDTNSCVCVQIVFQNRFRNRALFTLRPSMLNEYAY
uniref:Uncharacterized protein n=1 Tax=Cacopsylla melanoneura TaxID=428564 RepID=A0A8D9ANH5_9HEMI